MITLTVLTIGLLLFTVQVLAEATTQAIRREYNDATRLFGRVENVYPRYK